MESEFMPSELEPGIRVASVRGYSVVRRHEGLQVWKRTNRGQYLNGLSAAIEDGVLTLLADSADRGAEPELELSDKTREALAIWFESKQPV